MSTKRKLYEQEKQEKKILEGYKKSSIRLMSQEEFDRLNYLRKVDFTSCTKSCSPNDWCKDGKCDINGCYFTTDTVK